MKAIILAGGTGTRLWPLSRDLKPKQFHSFVGGKTMLQHTYERLGFLKESDIFVATNTQYENLVGRQLPKLNKKNLILEPAMRDTGPCICFAANYLAQLGFENEVMAVVYADHLIGNSEEFKAALLSASLYVQKKDVLGVIAVRAKYANPNLGYIRIGKLVSSKGCEVYELDKFIEKPTLAAAEKFLTSRPSHSEAKQIMPSPGWATSYKYLWNTGLYLWKISTILKIFERKAKQIYKAIAKNRYEAAPKISIDYAIIEKIEPKSMRVFPAELGWNDIGNFAALHEELAKSGSENITSGEHLAVDTEGSIIIGDSGKLVVTYGVKNMVIIDTEEALLVMPKEKAGEVKKIVEELKKRKKIKVL